MLTGRVTGGCSGVLPGDRGEGAVIWGVDLVQDLVGRVDDVRPQREVLSQGKLHFGVARGSKRLRVMRGMKGEGKGTFAESDLEPVLALSLYMHTGGRPTHPNTLWERKH